MLICSVTVKENHYYRACAALVAFISVPYAYTRREMEGRVGEGGGGGEGEEGG